MGLSLGELRSGLPEAAKDIKVNLQQVLGESSLSPQQKWGVALASAIAARSPELTRATLAEAKANVDPAVIEDAKAAAVLMGMNNVFYRFRHVIEKPIYAEKPARLRMQRIIQVAGNKTDFELFCLAVSAINGCEACVRSHEEVVVKGGLTEDHVQDAVRIAATFHAAAVAHELSALADETAV